MDKRHVFTMMCMCLLFGVAGCQQQGGDEQKGAEKEGDTQDVSQSSPAQAGNLFEKVDWQADEKLPAAPCALDSINALPAQKDVVNVDTQGKMRVVGWAATRDRTSPSRIEVNLVDTAHELRYVAYGAAGRSRPDVARILGAEGLALSGFDITLIPAGVQPGEYQVELRYPGGGGGKEACATKGKVYVIDK